MNEVTRILSGLHQDDPRAAAALLPLVYGELRKLAAQRLLTEKPGQTLQATALVHEAYLRLVDVEYPQQWHGRGHFFAAAAEAMRRIVIENVRRKGRAKHGGDLNRIDLEQAAQISEAAGDDDTLLELDAALHRLEQEDAPAAQLVKLRYFGGFTIVQAAEVLGVSPRKADLLWAFARAWLRRALADD